MRFPEALHDAAGVRELDRRAVAAGVASDVLMTRAGEAAFRHLRARWPDCQSPAIVCGGGNNGGDGYVVAWLAARAGLRPRVYASTPLTVLSGDARSIAERALAEGVPVTDISAAVDFSAHDLLVDGLLGTGLRGAPRASTAALIEAINGSGLPVLALDIPSGLDADSGAVSTVAVNAELTLTFVGMKRGLLTGAGPAHCGELYFDALGIPDTVLDSLPAQCRRATLAQLSAALPARPRDAHKGSSGHVLVLGGDYGYAGAVLLASEAAARSGAGLVSVGTRMEHIGPLLSRRPELMARALDEENDLAPLLERASVLVVGPGLGRAPWGRWLLREALASGLPMVLDADALNLIAEQPPQWRAPVVLTPHPGEAGRLLGSSAAAVQADRFQALAQLVERYAATVLLKGAGTLIAAGPAAGPVRLVAAGNPGMASAGMGDVLSGIIGALLAQGLAPVEAASGGALVHALAADRLAQLHGERGLLAADLFAGLRPLINGLDGDAHG